jgi:hypothetical protein
MYIMFIGLLISPRRRGDRGGKAGIMFVSPQNFYFHLGAEELHPKRPEAGSQIEPRSDSFVSSPALSLPNGFLCSFLSSAFSAPPR